MPPDEGASSGATTTATSAPAPGVQTTTHEDASRSLSERTQARRVDAERAAGFAEGQRGADGKFLPRAAKTEAKDSSATEKAPKDSRPPGETEKADSKVEETPQFKKLAAEAKALEAKHGEAAKKVSEWEAVSEQVLARLDAQKERISYLEKKLSEHGGAVDEGVLENLSLKEQLRVRQLADERANAAKEETTRAEQEQAFTADREQLRGEMLKVGQMFPELKPPFGPDNQEAGKFWSDIHKEIQAGRGSFAELLPRLAMAEYIAGAIKAKKTQAPPREAPRTLSTSRAPGGEPKAIDRFSIVEKHKARLRAV